MGFQTGDDQVSYGNDCAFCWAPGKTPAIIFIRFTGIKTGDLWVPGDGSAPNYETSLPQRSDPCEFFRTLGPIDFATNFFVNRVWVIIAGWPWGLAFDGTVMQPCVSYVPNDRIVPAGNHFYGGAAQLGFLPGTTVSAIHHVQDQLNMEHSNETFASPLPLDAVNSVMRFGRRFDATNILVKTEF